VGQLNGAGWVNTLPVVATSTTIHQYVGRSGVAITCMGFKNKHRYGCRKYSSSLNGSKLFGSFKYQSTIVVAETNNPQSIIASHCLLILTGHFNQFFIVSVVVSI
ncbi:MAG: hypothetical protein ACOYL3_25565, partial [Desulfuromonadaceae bacterium]